MRVKWRCCMNFRALQPADGHVRRRCRRLIAQAGTMLLHAAGNLAECPDGRIMSAVNKDDSPVFLMQESGSRPYRAPGPHPASVPAERTKKKEPARGGPK